MNFQILDRRVKPADLVPGDYIVLDDMLYRVAATHQITGYPNYRMLQLSYYSHENPRGYKFHEAKDTDLFITFRKID